MPFRHAIRNAMLVSGIAVFSPLGASEPEPDICPGFRIEGRRVASVDFTDFYPTQAQARQVADALDAGRFEVRARPAADGAGWVVVARYRELPSVELLRTHRQELAALGKRHGGAGLSAGCHSEPFPG